MLDEKDLQAIAGMLAQQKDDILQVVDNKLCNLERVVDKTLQQHTTRIELKIENEVSKKIETLFDGYKLTHEKQWEMERNMDITELLERSPINFREWKEPVEAIVKFTHGALWLSVYIGIAYGVAWRKEK